MGGAGSGVSGRESLRSDRCDLDDGMALGESAGELAVVLAGMNYSEALAGWRQ